MQDSYSTNKNLTERKFIAEVAPSSPFKKPMQNDSNKKSGGGSSNYGSGTTKNNGGTSSNKKKSMQASAHFDAVQSILM